MGKQKTISVNVPDYLTIEQYSKLNTFKGSNAIERLIYTVSSLTGKPYEEVEYWSLDSLKNVAKLYQDLADHKEEFHSIVEWNGTLYGYANIKASTLGEYVDLENLLKDLENNMHKVAAIFYRPITEHRFDTLSFAVKQKIKTLNNNVANVFDYYDVEKYDSKERKKREQSFKEFPAHIFLGALSFFLLTASLYLNNTASSTGLMQKEMKKITEEQLLDLASMSIGHGGGLSTTSQNPTYLALQGTGV